MIDDVCSPGAASVLPVDWLVVLSTTWRQISLDGGSGLPAHMSVPTSWVIRSADLALVIDDALFDFVETPRSLT